MAPLARQLSSKRGVLEPLQTADSLRGQAEELRTTLESEGNFPVTLVGFSYGAWLSFILAANHPPLINKLILIGSGPFEEKYVSCIMESRLCRLSGEEAIEAELMLQVLDNHRFTDRDKSRALCRLGELFSKSDAYDPLPTEQQDIEYAGDIFSKVWKQAAEWRRTGKLLDLGRKIRCPVVAIHGDHDPHPAKGVWQPLSATLKDFRFVLLNRCGHKPWIERQARDEFYRVLRRELIPPI